MGKGVKSIPAWASASSATRLPLRSKIDVENCHREIVGEFAFVLILVDQAQEFVLEIKLGGVVLARACLDLQAGIVEGPFEIGIQFLSSSGFNRLLLILN